MRRIMFGVIIFFLLFTQGFLPSQTSAEEQFGFAKNWETSKDDYMRMIPAISNTGVLYGVNPVKDGFVQKLISIEDGKIMWEGEDSFSNYLFLWPTLLEKNHIIAAGMVGEAPEYFSPLIVCYSTDGKKLWDKQISAKEYVPTYTIHDGKLWVIYDGSIWIYDIKSGDELKKINLDSIAHSSALRVTDDPPEKKQPKIAELNFSGTTMVMSSTNYMVVYEIGSNLDLKYLWEKSFNFDEDEALYWFLRLQDNSNNILLLNDKDTMLCLELTTGAQKWSYKDEYIIFKRVLCNEELVLVETNTGLACLDMATGEKLWESKGMSDPLSVNSKYAYVYKRRGDDETRGLHLLDLKTGERVSYLNEDKIMMVFPVGDSLYIIKEKSICKYTICNPCPCKVSAYWEETKSQTIEAGICPLQEKRFQLVIENPNDKAYVECRIATESRKISIFEKSFTLDPGQKRMLYIVYTSDMDEADATSCSIKLGTNCYQTIELELNIRKRDDCKKILSKQWEASGSQFYKVGKNIVYFEIQKKGQFDYNFSSIKAVSTDNGKVVWAMKPDQLIPKDSRMEIVDITGNNMLFRFNSGDDVNWKLLDGSTGKIVWKRTGDEPLFPDDAKEVYCDYDLESNEVAKTFFDPITGKTIIENLKLECNSEFRLLNDLGNIYVFQNGKDGWRYSDDPVDVIGVNAKGKIVWTTTKFPCINWTSFKGKNLFLTEKLSKDPEKSEDESDYILTRNDPLTLKQNWSIKIFGYPHLLAEFKDRIIVASVQGVFCIDIAKGNVIWKYTNEGWNHYRASFENNMIFVAKYPVNDDYSSVGGTFVALDPENGKVLFEKVINKIIDWMLEGKNLFLICSWYEDDGEHNEITKMLIDGWKELWTVDGKGSAKQVGDKTIIGNDSHIEWYQSGDRLGSTDIQVSKEDSIGMLRTQIDNWFDDNICIQRGDILFIYDSKTSELLAKISEPEIMQSQRISISANQYDGWVQTPCCIGNRIYLGNIGKLTCLSVVR